MRSKKGAIDLVTIGLVAVVLVLAGVLQLPSFSLAGLFGGGDTTSDNLGRSTTLYFGVYDESIDNDLAHSDVNAELWEGDNRWASAFAVDASPDSISSMPNTVTDGFLMVGNDNYVSTTDLGGEVYYTQYPVNYVNKGEFHLGEISVYNETTPTWTGYDDGTSESTWNITIGTAELLKTGEIRIQAGENGCLGNPSLTKPLALCAYGNNASTSDRFEYAKPTSNSGSFDAPEFLSNVIDDKCYILNVADALCDSDGYRFYISVKPKATIDPQVNEYITFHLLDKTYFLNDAKDWTTGWAFDSDKVSDTDIGFDGASYTKILYLA